MNFTEVILLRDDIDDKLCWYDRRGVGTPPMYRTRGNKFFLATHFFVVAAGFSLRSGVDTRRLKPAATEQTRNSLWVHIMGTTGSRDPDY